MVSHRSASFWRLRSGLPLLVLATAAIVSALPLGRLLSEPLEQQFAVPVLDQADALSGIIVLAGDHERFKAGVALAARYPDLRLVLVTGSKPERVRALAQSNGIADARMTFELQSKNTYENAVCTRSLLGGRAEIVKGRWVLVTSGIHMPRATGVFRSAGFEVVPYPVLTTEYPHHRHNVWLALREWLALAVYRLRGRTDALLPGAEHQLSVSSTERIWLRDGRRVGKAASHE